MTLRNVGPACFSCGDEWSQFYFVRRKPTLISCLFPRTCQPQYMLGTAARTHCGLIQHDVTAADRRSEGYFNIHAHNFTFRLSFAFPTKLLFEYDSSLSVANISKLRRLKQVADGFGSQTSKDRTGKDYSFCQFLFYSVSLFAAIGGTIC